METIASGNCEFTLERGAPGIFSYESMHTVNCDPGQTRDLLHALAAHQQTIEQAAEAQEQSEHQPKQPETIDRQIDDLFS